MQLTKAQEAFAGSTARYPAFVGGFGSGKTHAGAIRALARKSQAYGKDIAYYLPTYDLVRNIGYPRFAEMMEELGVRGTLNKAEQAITIPDYGGRILFRTMDNPERIVGYEVADSILDELDTLPTEKARDVWVKAIARNRQKSPLGNSVGVCTTPEGFRFVYERWVKNASPDYVLYRAKTRENPHLPEGYIESLESTYPSQLLAAYLDGEFVNLAAGTVYSEFDRKANHSTETIKANEPLHIGMDFNVTKMASVVHVLRDSKAHAVAEHTGVFDTPAMIALLKSRYAGHSILVYPDASGGSRKSVNASVSDIAELKAAGFRVCAPSKNPPVKDRVMAVQKCFRDKTYYVNTDACPELTESLEQQAYDKNGEPDKSSGHDHVVDGAGYFVSYRFPVKRAQVIKTKITGL